ncbi:MAG: alpha-(1-_3)-arabinofuranosyltransferase family protein, partial [Acidimicrobiales bacterium]
MDLAVWAGLAVISYLPSFLTQPGKIAADTKQYLYLDPGRLIQSAMSMWDPDVGAGTVTHQNIGFLFPMGPYYWLVTEAHIPIWIGQRFWMGSLFFAAGTGVWFLGRLLGLSRSGQLAAALAYMLTPYVLDYVARISAIVMPWAALGWMLALTVLAVRRRGWRYPALFAVVIALVGGVNATSILLVGLAPLLWVIYAVWGTREVTVRAAATAVVRIGVLGLGVSLWWMAGLWAEGAYGINVLKYTETLPTVSSTSLSSEVLRGLGYWYFYGQDKLGPWTAASLGYLQWTWLIVVSFMVPTVCIAAAMVARWRYRVFAIALVVVGVVLAVGTYPFTDPTPFGALIKAAGSDSTVGLALRSTNRIVPLVLLGLALLLGAGITAVVARVRWMGLVLLALCVALIAADLPPLWTGGLVAGNLDRPTAIPAYIHRAAAYMDGQDHDTRVLQLPGQDFAYYRWGVTSDPVWPGLMTRPYLIRSAVPVGEAGSVNLLQALDESIQDGVAVPSTVAPIAGLLSAGDILYESDVQFERFGTARPQPFWLMLNSPAAGLGPPTSFGTPRLYPTIEYPLTDETQLAVPTGASVPPPVAVFPVPDARPIARTESASDPLLVAGDGQGLVEAAAAGLLASNPTIFYSATFAHDPAGLSRQLGQGAALVLTDTNRKQLSTWGTVVDNYGYVEQANETPLVDNPAEASLPVFPDAGSGTQTVAVVTGVASVRATAYSNPITNTAENQPLNAVDGNPDTAWTEGAFSPATGQA